MPNTNPHFSTCPVPVAIIDDDPSYASLLEDEIRRSARYCVVARAGSAEEALAWPPKIKPAVVLLDVSLPGRLGSAAVRPLLAARPNLLIIMVTASTEPDLLLEAMSSGAVGYVVKGGALAEIVAAIDLAMEGGAPMSTGIARRLLRGMTEAKATGAAAAGLNELTVRERVILQFVADGLADKEIADRLTIAQSTVKNHLANIYGKWNVRSRTEAAVRYVRAVK